MDTYQEQQKRLIRTLEAQARAGAAAISLIEPIADYPGDPRLCLAGLAFLPPPLQDRIVESVLAPLAEADPAQYYYPLAALHVTIQNVRTISDPPQFDAAAIAAVDAVFRRVVPRHAPFRFHIEGLLELPASVALCAYSSEHLRDLVLELRAGLAAAGVPDNKAYASPDIFFGNITVCRFTRPPNAPFGAAVRRLKHIALGTLDVTTVVLVSTNAVCAPGKTTPIATYSLRP